MLLIVAHHYVVNSGLTMAGSPLVENQFSARSLFYLFWGAWGKTGINCFLLITGYFMCKQEISIQKFLKLLAQVYFYHILIYGIFLLSGYESFSVKLLLKIVLPFTSITDNFTGCFLLFFVCIPFLTILVQNLGERKHRYLLGLLLVMYVLFGSVPFFTITFNYVTWFSIVFLGVAYVRYYPIPLFDKTKLWFILMVVSIFLSVNSIICLAWVGTKFSKFLPFFFLADSNKILAVTTAFSSFMFFKNWKIPDCPIINAIASTCFGVLLIHAHSDTMRRWLWQDVLNNVGFYYSDYYIIHAIVSVLVIFFVCSCIEYVRIQIFKRIGFR